LTFIVQGSIVALFRADRVAARRNRPAIPPCRALSARKIPRNRSPSDKYQQPRVLLRLVATPLSGASGMHRGEIFTCKGYTYRSPCLRGTQGSRMIISVETSGWPGQGEVGQRRVLLSRRSRRWSLSRAVPNATVTRETVGHAAVPGGFAQPTGGSRRLVAGSNLLIQ